MRFFFLFLLLLPGVCAYDCNTLEASLRNDCNYLSNQSVDLIANLIYTNHTVPDHDFVANYNQNIIVHQNPDDVGTHSSGTIENAWFTLITIEPSIMLNETFFVPEEIIIRSAYDWSVNIPDQYTNNRQREGQLCRVDYLLDSSSDDIVIVLNGVSYPASTVATIHLHDTTTLNAELHLSARIRHEEYRWRFSANRWRCRYDRTTLNTDSLAISEQKVLHVYEDQPVSTVTFTRHYAGTQQAIANFSRTNSKVLFSEGNVTQQYYFFFANFTHSPYDFLQLYAYNVNLSETQHILKSNGILYLTDNETCVVKTTDFFTEQQTPCIYSYTNTSETQFQASDWSIPFAFIVKLLIVGVGCWLLWKLGKKAVTSIIAILAIPLVSADTCGLTNLAQCIPEALFNFITDLINQPIQPLLDAIRFFLEQPVHMDILFHVWVIILYVMGVFYLILLTVAGFRLMTAGSDIAKRASAKEWLQNLVLLLFFTSASFYLYDLAVQFGAAVGSGFLQLVDPQFFLLTVDNITNVALQFMYGITYLLMLLLALLLLSIRYILVALGVLLFPFGLLCYFIPPVRSYGSLILHCLGILICLPIVHAIIILACDKMLTISTFSSIKILLMTGCFTIINGITILAFWHIANKSGAVDFGKKVIAAGKYIAAFL